MGSLNNWLKDVELTPHLAARIEERQRNGRNTGRCKIAAMVQQRKAEALRSPASGIFQTGRDDNGAA
jgi:hypothetical protein